MLEYTRATIDKIHSDFKRFVHCCRIGTPIFSIFYMIYAICIDAGFLWANIALGVLSAAYVAFYLCTYERADRSTKQIRKNTRRAYKYITLLLKAYTIGMTIYGIYIATAVANPLAAIFAVLNLVAWTLQVLFELALVVFERYKELLVSAIQADFEAVTRPARAVGDFVMKIAGREPEPSASPVPRRKSLEKIVGKFRAKKEKEKLKKAELKKERKAADMEKSEQKTPISK